MRCCKHIVLFLLIPFFFEAQNSGYDELKKLIASTKDNADSLYFLNKQLLGEIIRLSKPKEELVECYQSLSEFAMRTGNLPEAESYASEAALTCEKFKIDSKLAKSFYQKARVFNHQSRSDEAFIYLRKGIAVAEKMGSNKEVYKFLSQIGYAYANQNKLDSALYYQNKALELSLKTTDSIGIAVSYSNIGYIHTLKNEFQAAKKYFYKSYYYRKTTKDVFVRIAGLLDCAEMEQKTNNPDAAIRLANEALAIIQSQRMNTLKTSCYEHITNAYSDMKRWDSAYKYHTLYKAASDSLINEQTLKASAKAESKYQLNSKQNEIALLEEKNKNNELMLTREKLIKWIVVGGLGLLVVMLFMVFRQLKIRKQAFNKINEQKIIIEEKNKEIVDSIHYAKRIQTALMSNEKTIAGNMTRLKKQ